MSSLWHSSPGLLEINFLFLFSFIISPTCVFIWSWMFLVLCATFNEFLEQCKKHFILGEGGYYLSKRWDGGATEGAREILLPQDGDAGGADQGVTAGEPDYGVAARLVHLL